MVRTIGLIFVFGIASLCLAAFIHASTAAAQGYQRPICPCWPLGLSEVLPDPTQPSVMASTCDTRTYATRTELLAEVDIFTPSNISVSAQLTHARARPRGACYVPGFTQQSLPATWAQVCMYDINDYCRAYCMAHPDSDPCSQ